MKKNKSISREQVKKIAYLARLGLSKDEIDKFTNQLSAIVDFVSQLNKVDTTRVEPTSQVTGLENIFREDKVEASLSQKEALAGAPETYKGYFKVRGIF